MGSLFIFQENVPETSFRRAGRPSIQVTMVMYVAGAVVYSGHSRAYIMNQAILGEGLLSVPYNTRVFLQLI